METEALSLKQYNELIKRHLSPLVANRHWVTAELSDVMVRNGHCYLELVQKDDTNTRIVAKCRGVIWANGRQRQRILYISVVQDR